jgi:hypothetical protein
MEEFNKENIPQLCSQEILEAVDSIKQSEFYDKFLQQNILILGGGS